jgi:hypothetical protein
MSAKGLHAPRLEGGGVVGLTRGSVVVEVVVVGIVVVEVVVVVVGLVVVEVVVEVVVGRVVVEVVVGSVVVELLVVDPATTFTSTVLVSIPIVHFTVYLPGILGAYQPHTSGARQPVLLN